MPLAGTALQVAFPCRPSSMARDVALAGAPVRWTLNACDAQDMTFAVAWADMPDALGADAALQALVRQAQDNLRAAPQGPSQPASVPGMTPHPLAQWRHWQGRSPTGAPVQQQQLVFVHGRRVFQASVLGAKVDAAASAGFFGALQVRP